MSKKYLDFESIDLEILFVLLMNEKMRFNQLHNELKDNQIMISKPRMQKSLVFLIEKGMVLREQISPQKVYYSINKKNFGAFYDNKSIVDETLDYYKERIHHNQLDSTRMEVEWFLNNIILTNLYDLKLKIVTGFAPDELFPTGGFLQKHINLPYESNLIEKCLESEEIKKETIRKIDRLIDMYRREIDADLS